MSDTNITTDNGSKSVDGLATAVGISILVLAGIGLYNLFKGKSEERTFGSIREEDLLTDLYEEDFLK